MHYQAKVLEVDLDCGIRYERIAAWLDDELALPCHKGDWVFAGADGTCRISATKLESRSLGIIDLDRTGVHVEGDEAAIEEFMRLFTLRFISAGG